MDDSEQERMAQRFRRLCRMMDEMLANMSPAERDRMYQIHLAAARGPVRNFQLLAEMTDAMILMRKGRIEKTSDNASDQSASEKDVG